MFNKRYMLLKMDQVQPTILMTLSGNTVKMKKIKLSHEGLRGVTKWTSHLLLKVMFLLKLHFLLSKKTNKKKWICLKKFSNSSAFLTDAGVYSQDSWSVDKKNQEQKTSMRNRSGWNLLTINHHSIQICYINCNKKISQWLQRKESFFRKFHDVCFSYCFEEISWFVSSDNQIFNFEKLLNYQKPGLGLKILRAWLEDPSTLKSEKNSY